VTVALSFRRATESDRRFVVGSFLDSMRASWTAGLIAMEDWTAVMQPQAEKLFSRPGCEIIVAYKPGEIAPYDVYGWIATESGHQWPFVTYVYVKENFRRWGIARRLFAEADVDPMSAFRYAAWMERDLAAKVPRARWSPLTVRFERRLHVEGGCAAERRARADQDRPAELPAAGRVGHADAGRAAR
jgi:GNAT superfamily N-acetyltransferase